MYSWRSNRDFRIDILLQYFYLFSSLILFVIFKLFFSVIVFYTILSYSLPNGDLQ